MITDTERREVARMLRELAGGYVTTGELESALGICLSSPEVDLERDAKDLHRLADLIEPPTQCPYYHSDRHYCSAYDDVVDRDALLELADEVYAMADEAGRNGFNCVGLCFMGIADRIRDALEVSE